MKPLTELIQTKEQLDQVSDSFCLAKWKNVTLHLHNGNTQSCHHVQSHPVTLDPANPSSLHNTEKKQLARAQMLKGERPKECQYCWKIEDKGEISDRVHKSSEPTYKDFWEEVLASGTGAKINPSFLEISFEHTCQLRCMYCSPAYSTQWEKEVREHGDYPITSRFFKSSYNTPLAKTEREKYIESFWRWWPDLKKELRYLRVTGGEPLLSPQTERLMQDLEREACPRLHFAINSNFAFELERIQKFSDRLNRLQRQVGSLSLFLSLDCTGAQAEYIRFGLDEPQFFRNVDFVLTNVNSPITLCFVITVNALSLPGLPSLLEKIANLRSCYPQHRIHLDTPYLKNPRHLSVEILTPDFRSYLDQALAVMTSANCFTESEQQKVGRIRPLIANPSLNPVVAFALRRDFVQFIREYDRRKGTTFLERFPEHRLFWARCASNVENLKTSLLSQEPPKQGLT